MFTHCPRVEQVIDFHRVLKVRCSDQPGKSETVSAKFNEEARRGGSLDYMHGSKVRNDQTIR